MNWLSREEIKRRAAISDEEALNVSIEEWEMKCEAARTGESIRYGGSYCGLCKRKNYLGKEDCDSCVLYEAGRNCCREYEVFLKNKDLANAQAMLNRLYLERGKRYGQPKKECKKEKPELRHGDCGRNKDGNGWVHIIDKTYWSHGSPPSSCPNSSFIKSRLSNLFDDLERNSKDLEDVKISAMSQIAHIYISGNNYITLDIIDGRKSLYMYPKIATKIAQAILQEVATAKRKAEKDC